MLGETTFATRCADHIGSHFCKALIQAGYYLAVLGWLCRLSDIDTIVGTTWARQEAAANG